MNEMPRDNAMIHLADAMAALQRGDLATAHASTAVAAKSLTMLLCERKDRQAQLYSRVHTCPLARRLKLSARKKPEAMLAYTGLMSRWQWVMERKHQDGKVVNA